MKRLYFLIFICLFSLGCSEMSALFSPLKTSTSSEFPHAANWLNSAIHGSYIRGQAQKLTAESRSKAYLSLADGHESCKKCHGEDFRGGISKVSCYQCHSYPHLAETWLDKTNPLYHGTSAMKDLSRCATACHGEDVQGGNSRVSCYICHQDRRPHPPMEKWTEDIGGKKFHGTFVKAAEAYQKCASVCHGENLEGSEGIMGCFDCHEKGAFPK